MKAQEMYTRTDGKFQEILDGFNGIIEPGIEFSWDDGYGRWLKNFHHYEYPVLAIHPEFVILAAGSKRIRVHAADVEIVTVEQREELLIFLSQNLCCDDEISDEEMHQYFADHRYGIVAWKRASKYFVNNVPTSWGCGTYRWDGTLWKRIAENYDSSD